MTPFGSCLVFFLLAFPGCHGEDGSANHLLLFDSLPGGMSAQKSLPLDIRTNFSGSVQLVESRDFRIVVNITAPSLQKAYEVTADFFPYNDGVAMEIKEQKTSADIIHLTWLFLGICLAAVLVGVFTGVHAVRWYKLECKKYDLSDRKSYASSSQRGGVYRSRNSIQLVQLPPGGDPLTGRAEELDSGRNGRMDEELRQVQEMPEEEEAEALEMEQLCKIKLQESQETSGHTENEDSDPQERNLIKSKFNSQAKTVHKDLIRKIPAKKNVTYKRTQNGTYTCVPTNQEARSDGEEEEEEGAEEELDNREKMKRDAMDGQGEGITVAELQVKMGVETEGSSLRTFGKGGEKPSNLRHGNGEPFYANELSDTDPMLLVMADVHKTNPGKLDGLSSNTSGQTKPAQTGNLYVTPSELKPVMSTFGAPVVRPHKSEPSNTIPEGRSELPEGQQQQHHDDETSSSPSGDSLMENVVQKYMTNGPWFTSTFATMSSISEDAREDNQSEVSGSAKSTSMYGSSEIFDANEHSGTYYNLDSDLDIPPLDAEDVFSDGGLPSPLGFPLTRPSEKGKVNDDIKLIPGALKSPGPNTGRTVAFLKPRPNSSIILRNDQSKSSGTGRGSTSTPSAVPVTASPPLPPPPEQSEGMNGQQSKFEFPPPPKFYQPPPWKNKQTAEQSKTSGDYVQIKHGESAMTKLDNPPKEGKRGSGTKGSAMGPTYMNLTLLSTLCVLTLATGVYGLLRDGETRVDITLFAPKHFLTNTTRVLFRYDKDTEILDPHSVLVYDVSSPLIATTRAPGQDCRNSSCEQGCDESSGACICLKGYKEDVHGRGCVDVNECMEARFKCNSAAGCYNRKGTYDCICGEDFYGNGKSCRECSEPCPDQHYEVQPCTVDRQKICKACTPSCRSGFYRARPCSSHANALCRVCRPQCDNGEFESRQCTNFHDRECTNSSVLSAPRTSKNVILEEKRQVKDDQAQLDKLPAHYVGFSRYKLFRGTGLYVELTVYFIDAVQQFLPVNMTQPFSLDLAAPSVLKSYSVQRYCPHPIPDYYILRYRKHQDLTYKQNGNGSIKACETHQKFGEFLTATPGNSPSFLCSQPGHLSGTFGVDDNFFMARTRWVDKSKRCQRYSRACEQCTRKCGTDMFTGDPTCSVAGDDSDNGVSPRLMTCYNCCVKRNCSQDCKDYHKRRCQPEQCSKGNLLEFTLEPSWDSSQLGSFFCHISPSPRQHVLELEYTVRHTAWDSPLHSATVQVYGDRNWEETGVLEHSDGILSVMVNSSLGQLPDFLEGLTGHETSVFKVGKYKSHGTPLGASAIRLDYAFIRPPTVDGVPPMAQSHQECTNTALNDMLLASNMENPYLGHSFQQAETVNYSTPFKVTSKDSDPVVLAILPRDQPILQKMFSPAVLKEGSFSGEITQNSTHWIIDVAGEASVCPGYIHLELRDPMYPAEALYDCDLAVMCPTTFSVTFALPTSDKSGMFKDVVVVVTDKHKVHHFRIFKRSLLEDQLGEHQGIKQDDSSHEAVRPAQPMKTEVLADRRSPVRDTPDLPLAFPYLLAIAGTILLLMVLAIMGFCFQPGLPQTPYAMWYHPLFAIGYMVTQFIYSLIISGSVFFIILTVITSKHVDFVLRYGRHGAVSTASSHIELLQLQRHLEAEVSRQDMQADTAQAACILDVKTIAEDIRKLHSELLNRTKDTFLRHRLDLLLEQQKLHVRNRLAKDLEKFRDTYLKAARSVLRKVNQNALASFQNVQSNNTWLDGARFLHEAVMLLRKAHRKEQKNFMEWTGISADFSKLEIDLMLSLPALPRLDDIPVPPADPSPINRQVKGDAAPSQEPIRSVQMHNNWFFPLEESGLGVNTLHPTVKQGKQQMLGRETTVVFFLFLSLFIVCDLVLLAHRMCKAWTTTKLILFGFPEYFRERKEEEMGEDQVFDSKESKLAPVQGCEDSPNVQAIKMFITQAISTTFFPKIVCAIAACVVSICLLQFSNKYLTVKALGRIGFYHSVDEYLDLQTIMTNARIETHATHINTVGFPAFQSTVTGYLARHRAVLAVYHHQLTGLQELSGEMYCQHLAAIGVAGPCPNHVNSSKGGDPPGWDSLPSVLHTCKFYPVVPKLFNRLATNQSPMSEVQVEALLESIRFIIYHSTQLMIIYLTVIVLKELTTAVLWILIQRSGIIRLRIIVEQDQDESVQ